MAHPQVTGWSIHAQCSTCSAVAQFNYSLHSFPANRFQITSYLNACSMQCKSSSYTYFKVTSKAKRGCFHAVTLSHPYARNIHSLTALTVPACHTRMGPCNCLLLPALPRRSTRHSNSSVPHRVKLRRAQQASRDMII